MLLALGCGKQPARDDCDKMIEHSIELAAKGQEEPTAKVIKAGFASIKTNLVEECIKKNTVKHVKCAIAAADLPALEACQSVN